MSAEFTRLLEDMAAGPLRLERAGLAFEYVLEAGLEPDAIRRFLQLSGDRLYEAEFLLAGAKAMRARMRPAWAPEGAIDVCGTGGDGANTVNVSTAVSFVVAAAGVPVAKHGNRAASSRSGAADVLQALGVRLDLDPRASFQAANLAFLFAPAYHPALAPLAPLRRALGVRTVFNVLGPLCNPAGVTRQLVGVGDPRLLEPMAQALRALGAERAVLVCGHNGVDEITPHGVTEWRALEDGEIHSWKSDASSFHLLLAPPDPGELRGGAPEENAARLRQVLTGEDRGAYWAAVIHNAAAALWLAERALTLGGAAAEAIDILHEGRALEALERLIEAGR